MQSSELQGLLDEKDHFLRILSHDLKNALANISGIMNIMESDSDKANHVEYVEMINKSTTKARDLIDRVLELDHSNQKNHEIELKPLDLTMPIMEVIGFMGDAARDKLISIDYQDDAHHKVVETDKTFFSLILENLLSNAIKFSERNTKILVILSNKPSSVRIDVIDEGPGIDPEEKSLLFQKFSKLSARPTAGESSTGLGLSLVKRYTELIGAKVWHEPNDGVGSKFIVELPCNVC